MKTCSKLWSQSVCDILNVLDETGTRANEAQRLEWTKIDTERRVSIKASKHGNARVVPISQNLIDMLFSLPKTQETVS